MESLDKLPAAGGKLCKVSLRSVTHQVSNREHDHGVFLMKGNCAPLIISLLLTTIKKLVGKVLLLTLGKRSQEAFQIFSFSVDQMSQHAKKEKKMHV